MSETSRGGVSLRERIFASFGNPAYRIYYGGMLGQMAAMSMQGIVGSLLIYRLTGSAVILGAMSFANAIPMICLSLFGGVIADRVRKKFVMIVGQAAFALVSLGVAVTLTTGYLSAEHGGSWWVLMLSSALQGSIMGLMMPSRQAIIPEIVSEDQLMNAISLNTMGMNGVQLFAPAVAGFIVDAFDFEVVYYTMTGAYIMAVAFFVFLPETVTAVRRSINALENIKAGLHYVRHDRIILYVLLFTLIVVLLAMPYVNLMPVFVDDILHVGASGMGILLSVSGVGAVLGSVVLASLPNRKRGVMLAISGLVLGVALLGFSLSTSWPLSLVLIVFVGLGQAGRMTLSNALLQHYVDDEYVGRVMSLFLMQFGFSSFSTFVAGLLTEAVGVQWAIAGFAMALASISALVLVFVPRIRKLD